MKKLFFISLISTMLTGTAFALNGVDLDLHGYLRSGVGSNAKGGDMACINNNGGSNWVGGNEFRLGNECDKIYSELTFQLHNQRAKKDGGPWWRTQFLWAYTAKGNTNWEDTKTSTAAAAGDTGDSNANMAFREAFVEAGNILGKDYSYWIGKRFYRDVNSNMNDWYYFADMTGNGAGIGDIKTSFGRFAFAMIKQTDASTTSDIGSHQGTYYDFRLFDVPFVGNHKLNFWAVYGRASGDTTEATCVDTSGVLAAVRMRSGMANGFNDFTVVWGKKLMSGLNLYGDTSQAANADQENAKRIRIVDDMTTKLTNNLEMHLTLIYEKRDTGAATQNEQTWKSIGIRPVYFFSDRFSIALEAGHSIVNVESDSLGDRKLTRLTVAPQLIPGKGIWARPVLRAFITHSFWNNANKSQIGSPFTNKSDATNFGFQAEVWF